MKKFTVIAIASVLIACIAFAGCTGTCWSVLYPEDNGDTKEIKQGCTIYIDLPENPTTGYSWEMDTGGLPLVSDEYTADPNSEGMAGAGGIHRWELAADNKGTYQIKGIYKRSWEDTTPDDKTWAVTVNVV